jgi:flagellar protein FliJ
MKKSTRLGTLASFAELKEKEAIRSIVEVQNDKRVEEQKLRQLEAFRDQYLESSQKAEQTGISVSRMLETRIFMDKISKAIQEQERRLCKVESQIQTRNALWTQSRQQRLSFEKLVREELRNQVQIQDKRDQIEMDDRSRRNPDNGT